MNNRLNFTLEAETPQSSARACTFKTLHNEVKTPVFMPVATFGALRNQNTESALALEFPVLLANTYHLLLRPGVEVFKQFGGIHRFMNWGNSVLTDSGGFQIFSLSNSFKITEEGARFKSYTDGREYLLSPELSIQTQRSIGSDIMMALDQCISSKSDKKTVESTVELTARWAERSLAARGDSPQSIFGIVQGACFADLRRRSAEQITSLGFDGFAIGGLAVGEEDGERKDMTALTASLLPRDKPRYLMGVGTPLDLLEAVHRGVDMFDCILPTALGQQGVAYTSEGKIELRRTVHKHSDRPLDENCTCQACRMYSRAYLHHLRKVGESFGGLLVGLHNLHFYKNLMDQMRSHILQGDFFSYYNRMKTELAREDEENPPQVTLPKKKKDLRTLGDFEVVSHPTGFHSVKQKSSGEVMHSVTDPLVEARELYVNQSGYRKYLAERSTDFVIWDVGLGAATNAMATILDAQDFFKSAETQGKLIIVSFENDLDSLKLAHQNPGLFPQVRHAAVASILKNHQWTSEDGKIQWTLLLGDFEKTRSLAVDPDCVYYDMFSLKTDAALWARGVFAQIFSRRKPSGTSLFTYSASTLVRGALLCAGFYVAKGAGAGPKSDTTAAFSNQLPTQGFSLLGNEWLKRWERSSSQYPHQATEEEKREMESTIMHHPQFLL